MSSYPTIVIDEKIPLLANLLNKQAHVIALASQHITANSLQNAQALIVRSVTTVDAQLLANTPVTFVASPTAGFNHLDTHWLTQTQMAWYYAAGCNAQTVAEYVLACVVNCQQHHWLQQKNLRAAVIGAGHIGQRVSHYLQQLGMEVICYDPPRAIRDKQFQSAQLSDLKNLDLVCLHASLCQSPNNHNKYFINEDFLSQQKEKIVIINAARGDLLDKNILLKNTQVCFCLDVWPDEPHVNRTHVDRCFIATPHIAGYSVEAKERASLMVLAALCQHFALPINHPSSKQNTLTDIINTPHWESTLLSTINPLTLTTAMKKAFTNLAINFNQYRQSIPWRHEWIETP